MGSKVGSGEVEAEPECLGGHGSTLSLLKPYRFPIDYDPVIQFRQSAIQSAGPRVGKGGLSGVGKRANLTIRVISLLIVPSSSGLRVAMAKESPKEWDRNRIQLVNVDLDDGILFFSLCNL